MKLKGNKILVTGGSNGIGLGLTEKFINEENTLIICGRRMDALEQVKQKYPHVITRQCDLSIENERKDLYEWIRSEHADLNVLINNAGIQNWMSVTDADFYDKAKTEIEINIIAPLHLTYLFLQLPALQTIMNVTSGLAFVPLLKVPVYSATKAFLHSFTYSLQTVLASKEIEIIEIIPPALNTDLGGKGIHDAAPPVSDFIESIFEQLRQNKTKLTYGFSKNVSDATDGAISTIFRKMNNLEQ